MLGNKAGYAANKQSLAVGRGNNTGGQGQHKAGRELYMTMAGAITLRNQHFSRFRVIQIFALQTYAGTQPLIESLSQRLKNE